MGMVSRLRYDRPDQLLPDGLQPSLQTKPARLQHSFCNHLAILGEVVSPEAATKSRGLHTLGTRTMSWCQSVGLQRYTFSSSPMVPNRGYFGCRLEAVAGTSVWADTRLTR